MKKLLVMMLVAILALGSTAFAATYTLDEDITFEYDENAFEIANETKTDDEAVVVLNIKNANWGEGFVLIDLADLEDGKTFPTLEEKQAEMQGVDVIQGDWANFKNVLSFSTEEEGVTLSSFIVPIYDDDEPTKVEDVMSVVISVTKVDDEQAATDRDDAISNLVDSLKVIDD